MQFPQLRGWMLVAACALVSTAAFAQSDFKDTESRITDFTLKNGLKFIVMERHQAPVAAFYTHADVGSVNESAGATGMAHMFEHMAFKGTTKIGTKNWEEEKNSLKHIDDAFFALQAERDKGPKADPAKMKELASAFDEAQKEAQKYVESNEFGRVIEESGGRGLNAGTSWDSTVYFYSLPSNQTELWFYLESERFLRPVLREFYKEADVVKEERRMRTDSNPIGKMVEAFAAASYVAHPYHNPPVGYMSDLNNLDRPAAEAFFKRYYIPSNLTCVVVGDVDPKQIKAMAEKYFERIPSGPKPAPVRTMEPKQEVERRLTLRAQAQRLYIEGYHVGSINDPDYPALVVLSSLMSEGRSSRLYSSLVRDQKIATQVFGANGFPGLKYPGLFLFFGLPAPGKTNEDLEKGFREQIDQLLKQPVSKEELEGVFTRYRVSLISGLNSNSGMAGQLAQWDVLTGDWHNLFTFLEKVKQVTPEDIQRVAKKTFVPNNRTVGYLEPETAAKN